MTRLLRSRRLIPLASLLLAAGACTATTAAPHPVVTVRTEPPPASALAEAAPSAIPQGDTVSVRGAGAAASRVAATPTAADMTATELPRLPGGQPKLADVPERRVAALDASGSDIRDVTARLGREFGLQVAVDPQVQGTVTAHLRNVSLDDALRDVVTQNGYQWAIQGGVLHVTAARLETRIFTLDYVALSRVGTSSTIVQRTLGSSTGSSTTSLGLSTGGGAAGTPGADVISSVNAVDMWEEIRITLTGLLAPPGVPGTGANAAAASPTNSGANTAARVITASSVNFPDGSNLTISPASGLINVTASPEKMAEVSAFLDAFRASVERQVLIEAKIVEVTLTKSLQYGIDWGAVSKFGSFNLNAKSGDPAASTLGSGSTIQAPGGSSPGNITFNLSGDVAINAVLQALSAQGKVSVLSSPRTSALNNQRAIFQVTTDEVFFAVTQTPILGANGVTTFENSVVPQQISVGIVLDVLPQISADNVLTMSVRPAVTSVARIASITLHDGTQSSAPVIDRREGDTMARLRAGETMVIGGLMQTTQNHDVSGIPVLKDLPLIGGLFRHVSDSETRSELVVFLTPTIISGQPGH